MISFIVQLWRDIRDQRARDIELEKMLQQELRWLRDYEMLQKAPR